MVGGSLRRRAALAVVGLVAASVGVAVAPVAAADAVVATETGDALEVAGSLVADAAPVADVGDSFVAKVAGSEVELPADPAEPLVLDGPGGEISVDLPVAAGAGDGVVDDSGAVVYESDVSPESFAAQATADGGMQVLLVIEGPNAPSEYRFDMTLPAGATLRSGSDGGVDIVGPDGLVAATVAPAWAVDSAGQFVPTTYRIDGGTLVQFVGHADADYPVIADPRIFWVGTALVAIEFTRGETKAIADRLPYFASVCAAVAALPVVGAAASAACTERTAATHVVALQAWNAGGCLVAEVGLNPRLPATSGVTWSPFARACGSTTTPMSVTRLADMLTSSVLGTIRSRCRAVLDTAKAANVCISIFCSFRF